MQTLRLETRESIRRNQILPERDRLAFSILERTMETGRPLILSDGERCILAQADVASPAWAWTRSDILPETLDSLLISLIALYEQGRLSTVVSKKSAGALIAAAFEGRIQSQGTLSVYRLDSLCPHTAEGTMIPGSEVPPETAGKMIALLAEFAGERISYETQRDMGRLFTQNPDAYAWKTPDGTVATVAKIAFSSGKYADIHSVYTREKFRNRGYAKALVSALSEKILDAGSTPMLYADRDYPPSNRVYRSIGFAEKARLSVLRLTEEGKLTDEPAAGSDRDEQTPVI